MSAIRSRILFSEIRPSARASGAPGQEWLPRPNATCSRTLGRSIRNSSGVFELRRITIAAPGSSIMVVPAAIGTSPTVVDLTGQPEMALHRAFHPQRLLQERGNPAAVPAKQRLDVGTLAETRIPALSSFVVVSIPAANKKVERCDDVDTSGADPSGYFA